MFERCRSRVALLSALALLPGIAGSEEAAPTEASAKETPSQVVERLHAVLIGVLKDSGELDYQQRYDRLAPAVKQTFDLAFMAEKSVGRYWADAGAENQRSLVDLFGRYTIANYANRFVGYSDQHFETLGEEPSTRGTAIVHTRLVDPTGEDVALDYRLRNANGQWRIVDIYLDGKVSELALRRSEYSSIIKRDGFQALLTALDDRVAKLASSAPQDSS